MMPTNKLDLNLVLAIIQFSSVQFSHSVVSDSLWPNELQHGRPPSPSPTPRAYSNSCPSSRWCHPTISSSVVPFSCPQSLPASGSFPMSQLFASRGQNIGVSAAASVLPVNTQDWFPLDGLVGSPCSSRDSQEYSPTPQFKSINSSVSTAFKLPDSDFFASYWENIYILCTISGLSPHTQHWATSFPTQEHSHSPWNSPGQNTGVGSVPFSRDLPNPETEPRSPAVQADSLPAAPPEKPIAPTSPMLTFCSGEIWDQFLAIFPATAKHVNEIRLSDLPLLNTVFKNQHN